jgi:hypothetical protein
MFYLQQKEPYRESYQKYLQLVGGLSNLFSDSKVPFLHYRIAEKIFSKAFNADDLSRSDIAIDVQKETLGIGLKTFLEQNNKTFQKVAEFRSDKVLYSGLENRVLINKVAILRNTRIEFAHNLHGIQNSIYHCVVRSEEKFKIYEEPMDFIDIDKICDVKERKGSIHFHDNKHEYSFLISKNTLQKRFNTSRASSEFSVKIIENPLSELAECFDFAKLKEEKKLEVIYLPLYGRGKKVYEASGLNSWNASQQNRKRDPNEIYIPIPIKVHQKTPNFFPQRDKSFNLILPNGHIMQSKVCQSGSKALMSYSNKELGKWLLRDVLRLKEGEVLTYEKLQYLGVDSLRIEKIDERNFKIGFAEFNSYEKFVD